MMLSHLPKTLQRPTASVVHTVSCVIFSYIFYGAKMIAHSQTSVALPASFLYVSFYLPLCAPQCL